ncbi:hypothetical protein E4U44_008373, partial [Claviceps purpurea]
MIIGKEAKCQTPRCQSVRLRVRPRSMTPRGVSQNSSSLKDVFKALQSEVEPYIAPDQDLPEVDPKASLPLASHSVDLALQEKKTILWERDDGSHSVRA